MDKYSFLEDRKIGEAEYQCRYCKRVCISTRGLHQHLLLHCKLIPSSKSAKKLPLKVVKTTVALSQTKKRLALMTTCTACSCPLRPHNVERHMRRVHAYVVVKSVTQQTLPMRKSTKINRRKRKRSGALPSANIRSFMKLSGWKYKGLRPVQGGRVESNRSRH